METTTDPLVLTLRAEIEARFEAAEGLDAAGEFLFQERERIIVRARDIRAETVELTRAIDILRNPTCRSTPEFGKVSPEAR